MKKIWIAAVLVTLMTAPAQAYDTGRSEDSFLKRWLSVEARGFVNLVSTPFELVRTPVVEARSRKWIWPVSSVPRFITNVFARATSSVYDIAFSPFVQPFTNDVTPLTEPLGLPDYAWQFEEGDI